MNTYIVLRCKICSFIYYFNGMYVCFPSMIDRLPQRLWQRIIRDDHLALVIPHTTALIEAVPGAGDTARDGVFRGRARLGPFGLTTTIRDVELPGAIPSDWQPPYVTPILPGAVPSG
jgi:hypothetical protein